MAVYHVAFTTVAAAAGAAYVDLRTGASDRVRLLECGLFATAATANTVQLERTTTLGTTSTTVVPQAGDPAEAASSALVGTAWSVAPASTAVPLRGVVIGGAVGAGVIWTFGAADLIIAVSASIALFNRGAVAGPICRGYFLIDD